MMVISGYGLFAHSHFQSSSKLFVRVTQKVQRRKYKIIGHFYPRPNVEGGRTEWTQSSIKSEVSPGVELAYKIAMYFDEALGQNPSQDGRCLILEDRHVSLPILPSSAVHTRHNPIPLSGIHKSVI